MGMLRTLGQQATTTGTVQPAIASALTVIAASTFSITNNIALITLASAMPETGYNAGDPVQPGWPFALGQQVVLWGFTTATYFNGLVVTVTTANPALNQFTFNFTHANVSSTSDAGSTAAVPLETYRAIRIEIDQASGTNGVYIGDLNLSTTRYYAYILLPTSSIPWSQVAVEIGREKIPAERVMITGTTGAKCQVSLLY